MCGLFTTNMATAVKHRYYNTATSRMDDIEFAGRFMDREQVNKMLQEKKPTPAESNYVSYGLFVCNADRITSKVYAFADFLLEKGVSLQHLVTWGAQTVPDFGWISRKLQDGSQEDAEHLLTGAAQNRCTSVLRHALYFLRQKKWLTQKMLDDALPAAAQQGLFDNIKLLADNGARNFRLALVCAGVREDSEGEEFDRDPANDVITYLAHKLVTQ